MADFDLNQTLITFGNAVTSAITGQPTVPTYQPGVGFTTIGMSAPPPSLLNPSTWSLPMWLLIGGGVFLVVRSMASPRRNPHRRRNPYHVPTLAPCGCSSTSSTPCPIHRAPGDVQHLNPNATGMLMNASRARRHAAPGSSFTPYGGTPRRTSHHRSNSPVRFHGAFAKQADAERKAAQLGGIIKSFTVRGQRRYSVMTAA